MKRCNSCHELKRSLFKCDRCGLEVCKSCLYYPQMKCSECVREDFSENYKEKLGLYTGKIILIALSLILILGFTPSSVNAVFYQGWGNYAQNEKLYYLSDTGNQSINGGHRVDSDNLVTGGWTKTTGQDCLYKNDYGFNLTAGFLTMSCLNGGIETQNDYSTFSVRSNMTCTVKHAWSKIDSAIGSFIMLQNGSNQVASIGIRGGSSTTQYTYQIDGGGYATGSSFNNGTSPWNEYILYVSENNISIMANNEMQVSKTSSITYHGFNIIRLYSPYNTLTGFRSDFFGLYCWNGTMKDRPQNPSLPLVATLSWDSQFPADLDALNAISNSSYERFLIINNTEVMLGLQFYHRTNNSNDNITYYINGTPYITTQGGFIAGQHNVTNFGSNWTFALDDNEIYPATYNQDEEVEKATIKNSFVLSGNSQYLKQTIDNVKNYRFGFLEFMVNSTNTAGSNMGVYYCNSSYTTGNVASSGSCTLFCTVLASQNWNHTHSQYESHNICPFAVNETTKKINGVGVSNSSQFVFNNPNAVLTWFAYYTGGSNRPNYFSNSVNNGGSYTAINGTLSMHLHQFNQSYFSTYITAFFNSGNSTVKSPDDLIDLAEFPPTVPNFINPLNTTYQDTDLFVANWTQSISPSGNQINYSLFIFNQTNFTEIKSNLQVLGYVFNLSNYALGGYGLLLSASDGKGHIVYVNSSLFSINGTALPRIDWRSPVITGGSIMVGSLYNFSVGISDKNLYAYEFLVRNSTGSLMYNDTQVDVAYSSKEVTAGFILNSTGTWNVTMTVSDSHTAQDLAKTYDPVLSKDSIDFLISDLKGKIVEKVYNVLESQQTTCPIAACF